MKALKTIAWSIFGLLAVACLLLLVPEYPDFPERSVEKLVSINVSPRGDRLLVRSVEHDYEFALPPNRLNDAFAVPPKDEAMVGWADRPDRGAVSLEGLRLKPSGEVAASVNAVFGGYDSRATTPRSILSERERAHLKALGFSPSNGNSTGNIEPPLYMEWRADIDGLQYPPNSRGDDWGPSLQDRLEFEITVVADNPDRLDHYQRMNARLKPLVDIKHGVQTVLLLVFLVVTGASPLHGG
ncbi:hypothetical protein ACQCRI_19610 [Ralstonia pseudosolanacearum]|uniref:hypothetical protein n=1 Tax=Ralstonia pseudosolanacearum TaxID=1310165 RepID=UPI00143340EE